MVKTSTYIMIEKSIVPACTFGETASDVVISPNTVQGCLPTSVITQPNVLAKNGKDIAGNNNFKKIRLFDNAPFFHKKAPTSASKIIAMPNPIIKRKLQ